MKRPARSVLVTALLTLGIGMQLAAASAQTRPMLRISSGASDVGTLDPDRATATADVGMESEIFNALVEFAPGSMNPKDIGPGLAASWDVSPDSTVWTFHLRKGVQFHGGYGELKASDVVYSLERAADPKHSSFSADFSVISKVEAVDDYTVRVTLKYPDASFLGVVSNYHGGFIISKAAAEKLGDKFGLMPIGTGPFAFKKSVPQQYVELDANDAYFRGKPKLGGVIYRMIPSDSARELAVQSGEIDLAYGKREQRWVTRMSAQSGIKVDVFDPAEYRTLYLNRKFKPLDELKVRQAIADAVNVDEILHFAGSAVTVKGCSSVPPGYLGEDCSMGPYPYDVSQSKKLLAEAGFPNGITIHSIVSNISAQEPIMEVIQAQLAKAGIKLDMDVVDHATYQAKSRQDLSEMVFYGAARFPTAGAYLQEFYDSASAIGSPTAMSNFSHCAVADQDIRAARVAPDPTRQIALWKDAQLKIRADVCAVPLFGLKQVWIHREAVHYGYTLKGDLNLQPPVTEATSLAP